MLILNPRSRRQLIFKCLAGGGLVVLLLGAWLAWKPALQRYRAYQHTRALDQAESFMAASDLPNAKLALDIALRMGASDLKTLRLVAAYLEQVGSREIMPLRRRIVALAPESVEDRALLVQATLRYDDLNAARDAVTGFTPEQANEPAALQAALAYAMATRNQPVADYLFDRLRDLESDNETLQVMHAILRLQHPDPAKVAAAERELGHLIENPRLDLFIQRERLRLAAAQRDFRTAMEHARRIAADPRATLGDHLNLANFELNSAGRPFPAVLAGVLPRVQATVEDAVELVRWILLTGHPAAAATWLDTLPAELAATPAIRALGAEVVAAQSDWPQLERLLGEGAWGGRSREVVQLAFTARTAAERGRVGLQRDLWREAINAAGRSVVELRQLHRLASLWTWSEAAEDTLWAIVRSDPGQAWAHRILFSNYRSARQTERLRALMDTLRTLDPTVPRYRHDWAVYSLLVQRTAQWNPPKTALAQLFEEFPANPDYRTTYAFALAQANRLEEAMSLVGALSPEEQRVPSRLPYLAYIYGVAREQEAYDRVVAALPANPDLLPEEQRLIHDGRAALEAPVPSVTPDEATGTEDAPSPPPIVEV